MQQLFPLSKAILSEIHLSKQLFRTLTASCQRQSSWIYSDDEGGGPRKRFSNRNNNERPNRFNNSEWDNERPNRHNNSQFSDRRRHANSWNASEDEDDVQRRDSSDSWNRPRQRQFGSSWGDEAGGGRFSKFGTAAPKPNWDNLEPIKKDFLTQVAVEGSLTETDVEEFRSVHSMNLQGGDVPSPLLRFTDYPFVPEIAQYLNSTGFDSPTPIQAQGMSIALSGRDFVGIARTGSGKTLGYMLPCMTHIHNNPHSRTGRPGGPTALVVAPTRELAQQIRGVGDEVGRFTGVRTACLFGGASRQAQLRQLHAGATLCIATPGRLNDFLREGSTHLADCSFLVLDEADRMLDMGFEPQIRDIINQIRPDRQTLMWSATWPRDVQGLARDFLARDSILLNIGSLDLNANPDIEQRFHVLDDDNLKLTTLQEAAAGEEKVLVFVETKREVDRLCWKLSGKGGRDSVRAIHGDISQRQRDMVMEDFRSGRCRVLIATDVASRGLDVDGISLVVNYDFPRTIDTYIHRIGRTARAGKSGAALSFLTNADAGMVPEIVRVLRQAGQAVPDELMEMQSYQPPRKQARQGRGVRQNRWW